MSKTKSIRKLHSLDAELKSLFQHLDAVEESILAKQFNGAWSPIQILEHLKVSESLSSSYIQYNIGKGRDFPPVTIRNWFNFLVLRFYLGSNIKRKAPDHKGLNPSNENLDYVTIKNDWIKMRNDLLKFLQEVDPKYYDQAVFKHFFVGRLSIYQMTRFFEGHFRRHRKQLMERLVLVQ